MSSRRYDKRDITGVAQLAETAAKVLKGRGQRAWERAPEFDASPVRTQSFGGVAGRGARRTEYFVDGPGGARELTREELEEGAPSDWEEMVDPDPTGEAALAPSGPSHREQLQDALRALDTAASRIVDLVDEITRTNTDLKPEDPRGWCPNCQRADVMEPSAYRTDKATKLKRLRDAEGRCRPCTDFKATNGFDRPLLIIKRLAEGRKLSQTEADREIARARKEHEQAQARAARRIETHREKLDNDATTVDRCPSTLTRDGVELRCELGLTVHGTHPGSHIADQDGQPVSWANEAARTG